MKINMINSIKHRITSDSILSRFCLVSLILLIVGGFSTSAWGVTLPTYSGSITQLDGVYYVLKEDDEHSINAAGLGGSYSYNLGGPAADMSFYAMRTGPTGIHDLVLTAYQGSTSKGEVWSGNPNGTDYNILKGGYQNYGDIINVESGKISIEANKLTFSVAGGGTLSRKFKQVRVKMAQYIENPTGEDLAAKDGYAGAFAFGAGKVDDVTSKSFTIDWCNVPAMTYSVSGTGASCVDVVITNNASAGNFNTATITVSYNRCEYGTLDATLNIADTYGSYSKNVYLSGSATKYDQTISWDNEALIQTSMLKGRKQNITATASSGLAVTYSSDADDILSVNASTGRLSANDFGDATITVSQAGNYKYNAATPIKKDFTVKDKDTPFFTPDGFDNESTCNLHVGDIVTLTVRNVTAGLDSYFTASATQDDDKDILEISRDGNTITIEALNAGSSTATFTQEGDENIYDSTITYSFEVSKITNTLAVAKTSYTQYVGDSVENVISGKNNTVTAVTTTSSDPTVAYYDVTKNKIYFPNSEAKAAPLATVTLHIIQAATYMYTGVDHTITLTVNKRSNTLKCAWDGGSAGDDWDETVGFDDSIRVKFTNTALDAPAIDVTPVVGTTKYATRKEGTSTNPDTLVAHHNIGNAVWSVVQPEDYKYARTAANCTLRVQLQESPACAIYSWACDKSADNVGTIDLNSAKADVGAAGTLTFNMKYRGTSSGDEAKVSFYRNGSWSSTQKVNATSWNYEDTEISILLDANTEKIKFEKSGSDDPYINNINVSRKEWFKVQNVGKEDIDELTIPTNVVGGVTRRATFYVDYSTCDSEIKLVSSHSRIKFAENDSTSYSFSTNGVHGRKAIELVYTSHATKEEVLADSIVVYTRYEHMSLAISAQTEKHTQTGSWKANINTLSLNDTVTNAFSSILSSEKGVSYTRLIGEGLNDAITITNDSLIAAKTGISRIRAYVEGNSMYKEIADTIDIRVTDSLVQYIVWNQDRELRRLKLGDSHLKLTAYATSAIDTCTTNGKRGITYSSSNESVVSVDNEKKELIIVGAGTATVTATADKGDDTDGHTYIEAKLTKDVIVRDPSAPCPADIIYTRAGETRLDHKSGDRYSDEFGFSGDEPGVYSVVYKGERGDYNDPSGTVYVEQYVNGSWIVAGSGAITEKSKYETIRGTLNRYATKIRIKTNGKGHHYFKEISVARSKYIEVLESAAITETLEFSSYIGTPQIKDVKVRWSDSRGDILLSLPEGAPFTLSSEDLEGECNGIDTTDLRITFNTMVGQTDSCYNLVLSDGVTTKTIVLKATATAETVTFKDGSWSNTPSEYKVATVAEDADLTISSEVKMYSLNIASGASVTVTPTGGLSVGAGGIANSSINKIKLESDSAGMTGYIRISPDYTGTMPEADVELFTKAYYNKAVAHSAKMQYIGVPVDKENYAAKDIFKTKSYVYSWSESKGQWVNNKNSLKVKPFTGYSITQYDESDGKVVEFSGSLLAPKDTTIELAYSGVGAGLNFLANSYAAPIDISQFSYSDFSLEDEDDKSVDYAIYLFNTGSKGEYKPEAESPASLTAAGQYITVSPGTALRLRGLDDNYPIVIPSMQGFFVRTTEAGKSLKLDYNKLIWNADYSKRGNEKLRVQGRASEENTEETEEELGGAMKISLYSDIAVDHMYLLESDDYSKGYENGYDGRKMMAGELNVYAVEGEEALAVDATNDLEGTIIGVRTGSSDAYTLAFSRVQNVENLFLLDSENGQTMRIEEGATYTFYAAPDCDIDSRFEIIGLGGQGVFTNIGNDKNETKAVKYIKDNTMYILKNGVKYTSLGQKVE